MLWHHIVRAALAGTERAELPETARRELAGLGVPVEADPVEGLLEALAAVRLMRRAAFPLSEKGPTLPEPAPLDARPLCGPGVVRDLHRILKGGYRGALQEFAALLEKSGCRLPPESLPELFQETRPNRLSAWLEDLLPALGPGALWLAEQHPVWRILLPPEPEQWFTGDFPSRTRLLRQARATRPDQARERLEQTWPEERWEDKAGFLSELRTGLSVRDEDFLEKALSDRARPVRETAFDLLMRIPGSRRPHALEWFYRQRLAAAAGCLFDPDARRLDADEAATAALEEALPDRADPELAVWLSLLPQGTKARWRRELLHLAWRHLPPRVLEDVHGRDGRQILSALWRRTGLDEVQHLLGSMLRHDDPSWLPGLWELLRAAPEKVDWRHETLRALLGRFFPESLEHVFHGGEPQALALRHLAGALAETDEPFRHPLPAGLAGRFLRALEARWEGRPLTWNQEPEWVEAVRRVAYHCRLEEAEALYDALQEEFRPQPGPLQFFFDIVRFRIRMHANFTSTVHPPPV
jgi:hypothetical protein